MTRAFVLAALVLAAAGCKKERRHTVLVTLSRGRCYGKCPVYQVKVWDDGKVEYEGIQCVAEKGSRSTTLAPGDVEELRARFEASGYCAFQADYTHVDATDFSTIETSYSGCHKTVRHYLGDNSAPRELVSLEDLIDVKANTRPWLGNDTGQYCSGEGW